MRKAYFKVDYLTRHLRRGNPNLSEIKHKSIKTWKNRTVKKVISQNSGNFVQDRIIFIFSRSA